MESGVVKLFVLSLFLTTLSLGCCTKSLAERTKSVGCDVQKSGFDMYQGADVEVKFHDKYGEVNGKSIEFNKLIHSVIDRINTVSNSTIKLMSMGGVYSGENTLEVNVIDFALKQKGNRADGPSSDNFKYYEYYYAADNIDLFGQSYPKNLITRFKREVCVADIKCLDFPMLNSGELDDSRLKVENPVVSGFVVYQGQVLVKSYCFITSPPSSEKISLTSNEIYNYYYESKLSQCLFRSFGVVGVSNVDKLISFFSPAKDLTKRRLKALSSELYINSANCILDLAHE